MQPRRLTRRTFSKLAGSAAASAILSRAPKLGARPRRAAPKYQYIDVHVHIGKISIDYPPLTVDMLLRWMDAHHVERVVILPLVSPEAAMYLQPTTRALAAARKHPDRLIPFCCIDPRTNYGRPATLKRMLEDFAGQGARGFGEHKVGLPFAHPLMMDVYGACEEVGLPILFHLDTRRGTDRLGLPGLEHALRDFPKATFIGHGPGFWASISGDVEVLGGRPKGKVTPGGALDRLMDQYPNLYGDLSAGSGANAIARDPEFSRGFLERRADRLMFGTDFLRPEQPIPQFEIYESMNLPDEKAKKIFRQNAIDVLKLS